MNTLSHKHKSRPTLLGRESTGGEVASVGLQYQSNVALAYLPSWLAYDGFGAITVESLGDVEAKFFVPGQGNLLELVEVKDHSLRPAEFWHEIKSFMELSAGSPGTYRGFHLVCNGLPASLLPLLNGLRRARSPWMFYEDSLPIRSGSYEEYERLVKRLKHSAAEAKFLFDQVIINTDLSAAKHNGADVFIGSLCQALPEYKTVSRDRLEAAYLQLKQLIDNRLNQPISRLEIEASLREKVDTIKEIGPRAIHLHTMIEMNDERYPTALRFQWAHFFGGRDREFPDPLEWNEHLLSQLKDTKDWIVQHRSTRRIKLTGNRRLSTSLAIGSTMSAVAGFTIGMESREGQMWWTDDHATDQTPPYTFTSTLMDGSGNSLTVVVSIIRQIASQVESCLPDLGLNGMPVLLIESDQPIVSAQQANLVVGRVKQEIVQVMGKTKCRDIHLFMAGPAFLALLLGHRLNAIGPIQCYEWMSPGKYLPTCHL